MIDERRLISYTSDQRLATINVLLKFRITGVCWPAKSKPVLEIMIISRTMRVQLEVLVSMV